MGQETDMNGVARKFWNEMHDLHTPPDDDGRVRPAAARARKKTVRKSSVRRQTRRAA